MPNFKLTPASSLGYLAVPAGRTGAAAPGVTIAELTDVSACNILACKGDEVELAGRVQRMFGIELPSEPRYTRTAALSFAWAGRSQWLALAKGTDGRAFESRLQSSLAGLAYVVDQSDARTIVRIGGARAREALAKGVHIDLDPRAFRPGDAAVTAIGHVRVHFWQLDSGPTYEFAVFRSLAIAFWEWMTDAAAEFGVAVTQA